jgi:hypothetical protein
MASVFTLFGELKADTRQFEGALHRAEAELSQTSKSIDALEKKSQNLGKTTSVSGRQFEKFNDTVKSSRQKMRDATDAFARGEISHRKLASVIGQTDNKIASLNSRLKDQAARLADMPGGLQRFATGLAGIATWAGTAAVAIGGFAVKSAMDIENARNKFTALEGSVGKANDRIAKLTALSRNSVGVNFGDALRNFAQLEVIGGIGENSINKMIQALGRLDTAFQMPSQETFLRNIVQIFSQNFEMQDLKQAIGDVPIFNQILDKAFGAHDPAKLKELKASGKLTLDSFVSGIAEAVETDTRLAGLKQTFSAKLSKALTEVNLALAPLGQTLIDAVTPAFDELLGELRKDKPDYGVVGDKIGQQIGKGIGLGIGTGIPNIFEMIKNRIASDMQGKTIPIAITGTVSVGQGILEGLGFEKSLKGAKEAFFAFINNVVLGWTKIALWFPQKVGEALANVVAKINSFAPPARAAAFNVGSSTGDGFIAGIQSKAEAVANAAASIIGYLPIGRAMQALDSHSPSKVFFKIGKDVAQGFIDGLAAMQADVGASMSKLLDISNLKGLKKGDAAGVELLTSLLGDLREAMRGTREQTSLEAALVELTAGKYAKLNAQVKQRIILAAQQIDRQKALNNLIEGAKDFGSLDIGSGRTEGPEITDSTPLLGGSIEDIKKQIDEIKDKIATDLAPPPALYVGWDKFWTRLQMGLDHFRESLPTMKQALGENLISTIEGIGDVFANSVANWDGTLKGFFKSLAQGFAQMVQQILSELVRLMVIKAIMNIVGAAAGGGGGGLGGGALAGAHMAAGGQVMGPGGPTSDSVPAMLSNGEFVMNARSVRKWGAGFFEALNNSMMPRMAFAGGGLVSSIGGSSASYSTNNYSQPINIYVQGGGSPSQNRETGAQIARSLTMHLQREQNRNK